MNVIVDDASADRTAQSIAVNSSNCPAPASKTIVNPFWFPITLDGVFFQLLFDLIHPTASCTVTGTSFNAGIYQSKPLTTSATTIGNFTGKGKQLVDFVPRSGLTYTLAANSTSTLFFIVGDANANAIPIIPGGTGSGSTPLTTSLGNPSNTALGIGYANGATQGTNGMSVACFLASDPRFPGNGLNNVYYPGTPKGACLFNTGTGSVTLGQTVTITITNPDPDLSFAEFDGAPIPATCNTATNPQCTTSVPITFQTAGTGGTDKALIFGNSQDMDVCVPKDSTKECRPSSTGTPSPNATTAPSWGQYDVLLSNDATYTAANFAHFGLPFAGYAVSTSGGCALYLNYDRNDDEPAGYGDPDYRDTSDRSNPGTYPSATFPMNTAETSTSDIELDLQAIAGAGHCRITFAELSNPQHKLVKDLTTGTVISYP